MLLAPIDGGDLDLYERLLCDPVMMAEIGGPFPREKMPARLARDVAAQAADDYWMLKIMPEGIDGPAAGTVCIWEHVEGERRFNEIGWMVLPEFQGKGIGTAGVRAILRKARDENRWHEVNAFPAITNAGSNGICRKLGFTLLGQEDFVYNGHELHCNCWRLRIEDGKLT